MPYRPLLRLGIPAKLNPRCQLGRQAHQVKAASGGGRTGSRAFWHTNDARPMSAIASQATARAAGRERQRGGDQDGGGRAPAGGLGGRAGGDHRGGPALH